ncbi:hypothetical protein F5888DRAFT_1060553 [Russula emetica]|nr:hypothetical protein F5888DRAFT_1060553 [Russula emetica]
MRSRGGRSRRCLPQVDVEKYNRFEELKLDDSVDGVQKLEGMDKISVVFADTSRRHLVAVEHLTVRFQSLVAAAILTLVNHLSRFRSLLMVLAPTSAYPPICTANPQTCITQLRFIVLYSFGLVTNRTGILVSRLLRFFTALPLLPISCFDLARPHTRLTYWEFRDLDAAARPIERMSRNWFLCVFFITIVTITLVCSTKLNRNPAACAARRTFVQTNNEKEKKGKRKIDI